MAAPWYQKLVGGYNSRQHSLFLHTKKLASCDGRQHEDFGLLEGAAAGLLILETVAAFLWLAAI